MKKFCFGWLLSATLLLVPSIASAQFSIEFSDADFGIVPEFGTVNSFEFAIDVADPLVAGGVYSNPVLDGVSYSVFGLLEDGVPSGFPAFNLVREIGGQEFFDQGSSLNFTVDAAADLSDGLQISELVADANGLLFEFNGRELNTGRFHPPLLQLFSSGFGAIQNSDNLGGVNPLSGTVVDVGFGAEYVNGLTFDSSVTLVSAIPEPSSIGFLFGLASVGLLKRRR